MGNMDEMHGDMYRQAFDNDESNIEKSTKTDAASGNTITTKKENADNNLDDPMNDNLNVIDENNWNNNDFNNINGDMDNQQ